MGEVHENAKKDEGRRFSSQRVVYSTGLWSVIGFGSTTISTPENVQRFLWVLAGSAVGNSPDPMHDQDVLGTSVGAPVGTSPAIFLCNLWCCSCLGSWIRAGRVSCDGDAGAMSERPVGRNHHNAQAMIGSTSPWTLWSQRRPSSSIRSIARRGPQEPGS